jgi:hypothetical protein
MRHDHKHSRICTGIWIEVQHKEIGAYGLTRQPSAHGACTCADSKRGCGPYRKCSAHHKQTIAVVR